MKRTRVIFRRRYRELRSLVPHLRVGLSVGDVDDFPDERDFAMCALVGPRFVEIMVAPKIEDEADEVIEALLRHEMGHAVLLYRGQTKHSEREADELAELLWGDRINYDVRDVETIGPGAYPRPWYLPK